MNPAEPIAISNIQFICPKTNELKSGHVVIKGNFFEEIRKPSMADLDGQNQLLIHGAFDLSVRTHNLSSDYQLAANAGITQFCLLPNSLSDAPFDNATNRLPELRDAVSQNIHLLGAASKQLGGELLSDMAALKHIGCVGLSDAGTPWANYRTLKRAMEYAASMNIPLHLSAQDAALIQNGCAHDGFMCAKLGLIGIPDAAETGALAMIIELAHETKAKVHINFISCARSVTLIQRAKAAGLDITAGVSIHHLLMNESSIDGYNTLCHIYPPLRSEEDRLALIDGVNDGTIDAITCAHEPCSRDSKESPFPSSAAGISALPWLIPLTLTLCQQPNGLKLTRAIDAITKVPANIAGKEPLGFVLCDLTSTVTVPEYDDEFIANPYIGNELLGKVTRVIAPRQAD